MLKGIIVAGRYCLFYRPVYVGGKTWRAFGHFHGGLHRRPFRLYLSEAEAMEWYDKSRVSISPAVVPTPC